MGASFVPRRCLAGATNNEYPEGKMTKAGNFIFSTNEGKAIGGRSF
jgi:hypothetical protein